jgi:hypothetical protein
MNISISSLRGVFIAAGATVALGLAAAPASAQTSVNVTVGQPGFYGQLNIGGYPPPPVYYPQPVVIEQRIVGAPVYLRVPEGHRKHWAKHCARYNACGRQVFFVQDNWYEQTYAPRYREMHYRDRPVVVQQNYYREPPREVRREEWRERTERKDHDDHGRGREEHDDHGDRGEGHGNGHGKGHGKHGD